MAVGRITLRERKALRSAAAKKGWETRRAHDAGFVAVTVTPSPAMLDSIRMHAALTAPIADPNPWPRLATIVRSWWRRATGRIR